VILAYITKTELFIQNNT